MRKLKEIYESLKLVGNKLEWDSESTDIMKGKFGKNKDLSPYITTLKLDDKKVKIMSMFKRGDDLTVDVLKAMKKAQSNISIDDIAYYNITNRAAIYLNRLLKDEHADIIITPQSSSNFNNDVLNKFRDINPYISIYFGGIYKNPNLHEITFDNSVGFNAKTVSNQENDLKKYAEQGKFEIKRVDPKFRSFIRNWLLLDDSLKSKIKDKSIVIFDDYLTTGASLLESAAQLYKYGAKTVVCVTFLHKN